MGRDDIVDRMACAADVISLVCHDAIWRWLLGAQFLGGLQFDACHAWPSRNSDVSVVASTEAAKRVAGAA